MSGGTLFFYHIRKLRLLYDKKPPAGCAARGVEISCKQHRSRAANAPLRILFYAHARIRDAVVLKSISAFREGNMEEK